MKICGIYKIISPSKKIYIGQSIDIISRWDYYKRYDCERQSKLYNSLKKHGWDKHKFEIICQCDKIELNNLERYYIELYQTFNNKFGLNLQDGGNGGRAISEETKQKIRDKRKLQVFSEESKAKMRKAWETREPRTKESYQRGKETRIKNGKKLSKEAREKISLAHKGNTHTKGRKQTQEEINKKITSRRNNGKPWLTEETKLKSMKTIAEMRLLGKIKTTKGQKRTEEQIKRIVEAHKGKNKGKDNATSKRVINIITGEIYDSMQEVADLIGMSNKVLSNRLLGKRKNNTNFKYLENEVA
jgi:group I intron endonuclease